MELERLILSEITPDRENRSCFLSFVYVSSQFSDMCAPFGILIKVRNSARSYEKKILSGEGK